MTETPQDPQDKHFLDNEDGAVTVDWVAITGLVVVLGLLTVGTTLSSVDEVADYITTAADDVGSD